MKIRVATQPLGGGNEPAASDDVIGVLVDMLKTMKKFHRYVMKMRSSLFCTVCNWQNHTYINPETEIIHYNYKFCKKFFRRWMIYFVDKYEIIVSYLLMWDEFIYILSNTRLMKYTADRIILKRYVVFIRECKVSPRNPNCRWLCLEYNVNKFSYLYDGEARVIRDFMNSFFRLSRYLVVRRV